MSNDTKDNVAVLFAPKPGSVPDRAHRYLLGQPPGTFITSPELAKILGVQAKAMMGSLASLVAHGLVKRERRREGYGYLLGDSFDADEANGGKPVQRIVPAATKRAPVGGVPSVFQLGEAAASSEADPALNDAPAAAPPAPKGLNWRPGKPLTPSLVDAPAEPAPASAPGLECALWSNGELWIRVPGSDKPLVLCKAQTRALVHYLDNLAHEPILENT